MFSRLRDGHRPSGIIQQYGSLIITLVRLAQSIYSIALDNRATGFTKNYNAEVASIAKKDLKKGEILDGEGGFVQEQANYFQDQKRKHSL